MVQAAAKAIQGKPFPALGHPKALQHIVRHTDHLPVRFSRAAYAAATGAESIASRNIGRVSLDGIAEWTTDLYPKPDYPVVFVGSSSGALVHLAAALGAPWLPQTMLIPLRRKGGGIDDPKGDLAWARPHAERLLANNPGVQLHQMHDPSQDRLSLQYLTYFRTKYRRLPPAYRRFLNERLRPGATIILSECTRTWKTLQVGDRHVFQFGAVGGMEADEYTYGSPRVAAYLEHYDAGIRSWDAPVPDGESPEAEWGFEESLRAEVLDLARKRGLRVLPLVFREPDLLSPLVADLHRAWYRRLGRPDGRLLVGSFVLLEPHWTLRTGSVPYWVTFNAGPELDKLHRYLDSAEPYDEMGMMIFPHGTESVGLPTLEDWRGAFDKTRHGGRFVGMNEWAYPHHFASLAKFYLDLSGPGPRYPLPAPMPLREFEDFCADTRHRYSARLEEVF